MRPLPLLGLLLLAAAAPLAQAAPEQVHLGLPTADASTARSVLWLETAPSEDPVVRLRGPDGERVVEAARVDGPSAGFAYEARLTGLAPATTYAYEVGGRAFGFTTAPAPGAGANVTFVALGDMGITEASRRTVARIQELAPDFVLHAGDLSYAEGNPAEWKAWFDLVEPVAASTPWIPALGNHETYSVSSLWGLTQTSSPVEERFYLQRFGLPGNELWYSFDWGPLHVVALDTFSSLGLVQAQLAWLEQDLAASAGAAWTLAFLHEPPYSSNDHGDSLRVQEALVPLLEAGGVDLVIAGHDHGYERSWPMRAGRPVVTEGSRFEAGQGTVYLVTGGGGQSLYAEWTEEPPAWSAARESLYHVTEVRATPEALDVRVVPTDGSSYGDAFRIVRASVRQEGAPAAVVENAMPGVAPLVVVAAAGLVARARRR